MFHLFHAFLKLLSAEFGVSFPDFFQDGLLLLFFCCDNFSRVGFFNFVDGFLFVFEDFWGALVDGFELLFMVEVMRGFVLDFEVAESAHLLLHVDKVAVKEAFFLDEVVEVELLEPVRCDVLFIGLIGDGVAVMVGFLVFVGLRKWFLFGYGF